MSESPRPAPRVVAPAPEKVKPSARSEALSAYYQRVENNLVAQGLLRQDGGGPDTPFSKRQLVENFIQIGVFDEYQILSSGLDVRGGEGVVRRFQDPVRVKLDFAQTISDDGRADLRKTTRRYLRRLSRVTGHPIQMVENDPNMLVAVLDVDALEGYASRLMQFLPALGQETAARLVKLQRPDNCVVYTFDAPNARNVIDHSIVLLRAEHPRLMRDKCLHEEIAQGLGLTNDSPAARPSIFNDDDEFALLTRHDELLLQILYDDRLPLGFSPAAARPVVEVIAAEVLGGES